MTDNIQFQGVWDVCIVYYTTQLVRCLMFSYILLGIVMLLRRVLFSKQPFVKGMLWGSICILPFLGRLRLFYESRIIVKATWWMTAITMKYVWLDKIYMAGIFITAILIFNKRLRLKRVVSGMERAFAGERQVAVTDMDITPFTIGLIKPRIVVPRVMLERYSEDEIQVVLQHEQTHIRLGHLWCYLIWDILRCLLWVNPLFSLCQKQFRADLEGVCDRICIQNSKFTVQEYGRVLLKSLKLLRSKEGTVSSVATYAGEQEYEDMKRRVEAIVAFKPYRRAGLAAMTVLTVCLLCGGLFAIHCSSYPCYSEIVNVLVYQYVGGKGVLLSDEDGCLQKMIHYDKKYVYVKREEFEGFLRKHNARGEIFIVFGGFQKFPGMGGNGYSCFYEDNTGGEIIRIPYQRPKDSFRVMLFKLM